MLFALGACNESFDFDVPAAAGMGGAGGAGGPGQANTGGMAGATPLGGGASSGGASPGGASPGGASLGGASLGGASSGGGSDDAGLCGECPSELHCVDGQCRACATDSDCLEPGLARCDLTRYRCVGCILSMDCADGLKCDSLANRCLPACQELRDCPETAHGCNTRRGVCYECDDDRECASSSIGKFCAVDGSGCVQCRNDADCDAALCDQLTGRCVECRDGLDCTSRLCDPLAQTCLG